MKELSLIEIGLDADKATRSPCFDCERIDKTKLRKVCANCPDRIAYAKLISGPTTVEQMIALADAKSMREEGRPRFCKCGGIHYAKNMCRNCYQRFMYKKRKLEGRKQTVTSVTFTKTSGGPELLALIKSIARHEGRSLNSQIIIFLSQSTMYWLEENE